MCQDYKNENDSADTSFRNQGIYASYMYKSDIIGGYDNYYTVYDNILIKSQNIFITINFVSLT